MYGSVSVTFLGMQLYSSATSLAQQPFDLLYRINLDKTRMTEQTEASDTEDSMKDVDHIARTIRHAAVIRILPAVSNPTQSRARYTPGI